MHEYASAWISMLGNSSLKFKVRAGGDVYLALSELTGHTQSLTYEIVIGCGNNSQSQIRQSVNGEVKTRATTTDILSGSEMRPFWISWKRGAILVGHGDTIGERSFLMWKPDSPHDINAVSMTTGEDRMGAWEFYTPIGK